MLITCNGYKYLYNKLVHGVPFIEAAERIFSTQAILHEDIKHSTNSEKRFRLISISPTNRILSIIFCTRIARFEKRIIPA